MHELPIGMSMVESDCKCSQPHQYLVMIFHPSKLVGGFNNWKIVSFFIAVRGQKIRVTKLNKTTHQQSLVKLVFILGRSTVAMTSSPLAFRLQGLQIQPPPDKSTAIFRFSKYLFGLEHDTWLTTCFQSIKYGFSNWIPYQQHKLHKFDACFKLSNSRLPFFSPTFQRIIARARSTSRPERSLGAPLRCCKKDGLCYVCAIWSTTRCPAIFRSLYGVWYLFGTLSLCLEEVNIAFSGMNPSERLFAHGVAAVATLQLHRGLQFVRDLSCFSIVTHHKNEVSHINKYDTLDLKSCQFGFNLFLWFKTTQLFFLFAHPVWCTLAQKLSSSFCLMAFTSNLPLKWDDLSKTAGKLTI